MFIINNKGMVSKTHKIIINSSTESCFKVPIYCDVKDIMTGYGPLPPSEGVILDNSWANPKGSRTVLAFGKPLCIEKIIEREENKYWKYELIDFQQTTFFFVKRVIGEIVVINIAKEKCEVATTYSFENKNIFTSIITYLFVKILWSGLQKKGLRNIKKLAENNANYIYPKSA